MAITTIVPAILSKDSAGYKQVIKDYYPFAKRVHVDISDGTLTESKTIPLAGVWWPKGWTLDIHLISSEPAKYVDTLLKIHPDLVIFHAEAKDNLLPIFDTLKKNGIKVGVAIIKNVYPGSIKEVLNAADHALIFSGDLGNYGGEADLLLLEKVELIRNIHKNIEVGWDGGANKDNIRIITHAEVNVINVGSAIAKSDNFEQTYKDLNAETEKQEAL